MRFNPQQPRDDVNVSKEHPLVEAGTLFVGLGLIFAIVAVFLVFLVEIALYFIPVHIEARMFNAWLPDDIATVAPDDARLEKLEEMVWRMSRHWPESPYELRIEIDDSPETNAVALPGGLIIVTAGLLDQVESENELAFVLGHELGHFRNRDHMRGLGRGTLLGLALAVLGVGGGGVDLGTTVADMTLRGFSRRQESAADEFGLQLLSDEYGHVNDSWRFFERMGGEGDLGWAAYISTHPAPDARAEALVKVAGRNGWSISGDITAIDWGDLPAEAE